MKLIITEGQYKKLPLITENIEDNPILNLFKITYSKNKGRINNLYQTLMGYTVEDVLREISKITDIESFSEVYSKEVNDMVNDIHNRVNEMSEEEYDRNERMINYIVNEVEELNDIIYKKHSAIERIVYGLTHMKEVVSEEDSERKYNISTVEAFSDIRTLDV